MKRKPVIAANWKMHLTRKDAAELAGTVLKEIKNGDAKEVVLFPSFLQISTVADVVKGSNVGLGGQNLYFEEKGAFTGEVAAFQLLDAGCSHVLIGHSERRHYFQEDYETVNRKVQRALDSGLQVMLCVGESLEERENNVTEMVVVDQIESALQNVDPSKLARMTIAYEPIWAIGTGKTATPQDANHVHSIIRKAIRRLFDDNMASEMRILYGGSVKADNIRELMAQEDIDGALVGGASLKADSFISIVNYEK